MKYGKLLDLVRGSEASNTAISLTVGVSTFLLSLLGCLFYNFWADATAQAGLTPSPTAVATGIIYLLVLLFASIALLLIMRTAFTASMQNRVHQLGLLSSAGATPKQIKALLFREGMRISLVPVLMGIVLGGLGAYLIVTAILGYSYRVGVRDESTAGFTLHPFTVGVILLIALMTIAASASAPARKLSKTTPLSAIGGVYETISGKKRSQSLLGALFGIEGELEVQSLAQRRASFRTATLALVFSFIVLGLFLSFMTASNISVNRTYYEKYGVTWDYVIDFPSATTEEAEDVQAVLAQKACDVRLDRSDKGERLYINSTGSGELFSFDEVAQEVAKTGIRDFEVTDMAADKQRSEEIWRGYTLIVGGICAVLALIGIFGVAAQAVNANHQRRREFARLRSIGLAPDGVRKMLGIEALAVLGRPLAIAIPLVVVIAATLMVMSRNTPVEFLANFPFAVVIAYAACMFAVTALAYWVGSRKIARDNIAEALRDDSLL